MLIPEFMIVVPGTSAPITVTVSNERGPAGPEGPPGATGPQGEPGTDASGLASGLETTGDPVDVAASAPPVEGQVLTAMNADTAVWRVPGLHYDPSIKFWTGNIGSATILPGTWGFIWQPADGITPVVVHIVSSLEAPPVDARFALYVGKDLTVPVTVRVLGTSQIQGLDGVLADSTTLLPGADYEWIFYHEDGNSIWGLVSDTAGVAKRLRVSSGTVDLAGSPAPTAGQALIATDATHAAFANLPAAAGSHSAFAWTANAASIAVAGFGAVWAASNTLTGNSTLTLTGGADGRMVRVYVKQDATGGRTLALSIAGRAILRDSGVSDDNPAAGANAVTAYEIEFLTIIATASVRVRKMPLA